MIKTIIEGIAILLFILSFIRIFKVIDRRRNKLLKFVLFTAALIALYLNKVSYLIWLLAGVITYLFTGHSFALSYIKRRNKQLNELMGIETEIGIVQLDKEEVSKKLKEDCDPDKVVNAISYRREEDGKRMISFTPAAVTRISKSEQDFILSHELAHHLLGHLDRGILREILIPFSSGILGGLLFGPVGGFTTGCIITSIIESYFSKREEKEADELAVKIMLRANLNPYGALKFFERQIQLEMKYPWYVKVLTKFFGTHPMSKERYRYLRELLNKELLS